MIIALFSAIKRRIFKHAIVREFYKLHGLDPRALADHIGPGTLDDLLNIQYVEAHADPALGAKYLTTVLRETFGIDVKREAVRLRKLNTVAAPARHRSGKLRPRRP